MALSKPSMKLCKFLLVQIYTFKDITPAPKHLQVNSNLNLCQFKKKKKFLMYFCPDQAKTHK